MRATSQTGATRHRNQTIRSTDAFSDSRGEPIQSSLEAGRPLGVRSCTIRVGPGSINCGGLPSDARAVRTVGFSNFDAIRSQSIANTKVALVGHHLYRG